MKASSVSCRALGSEPRMYGMPPLCTVVTTVFAPAGMASSRARVSTKAARPPPSRDHRMARGTWRPGLRLSSAKSPGDSKPRKMKTEASSATMAPAIQLPPKSTPSGLFLACWTSCVLVRKPSP